MTTPASTRTAITPRSISLVAGALALAAIAWNAGSVAANLAPRFTPPPPAVVGVVDLEAVLGGLQERIIRQTEFQAKIDEQEAKVKKMGQEVKTVVEQLDAATAANKPALLDKARELSSRAKFEADFAEHMLKRMQADLIRDLYDKIDKSAEHLAQRDGYAMVLASDASVEVPNNGNFEDVRRGIALKRMLYVAKELDITPDLITLMNNEFAAANPGGAAAPAPAPAKPTAAVPTTKKN